MISHLLERQIAAKRRQITYYPCSPSSQCLRQCAKSSKWIRQTYTELLTSVIIYVGSKEPGQLLCEQFPATIESHFYRFWRTSQDPAYLIVRKIFVPK